MPDTIHASAFQFNGRGILLRGASNSGKSSITLKMIDDAALSRQSCDLVADDQVILEKRDGTLCAKAPDTLFGLIEVRGIGVVNVNGKRQCSIDLIVDLVPREHLERLPDQSEETARLHGVNIRRICIAERNPDACTIIRTVINTIAFGDQNFTDI